jgi:hypothetical protein
MGFVEHPIVVRVVRECLSVSLPVNAKCLGSSSVERDGIEASRASDPAAAACQVGRKDSLNGSYDARDIMVRQRQYLNRHFGMLVKHRAHLPKTGTNRLRVKTGSLAGSDTSIGQLAGNGPAHHPTHPLCSKYLLSSFTAFVD